jgi:hypothetical protein
LNVRATIRRAAPADAPFVIAGINAVCAEGWYFYTDAFVITPPWEAVLYRPEQTPQHLLMVAQLDGKIVGAARLFSGVYGSKDRHVGEMGAFVLAPWRNQGIGTALVQQALEWAGQRGLEKVVLSVFATNRRAIHVFEKCGFAVEGARRRQYKIAGQYVDELFMARFLEDRENDDGTASS